MSTSPDHPADGGRRRQTVVIAIILAVAAVAAIGIVVLVLSGTTSSPAPSTQAATPAGSAPASVDQPATGSPAPSDAPSSSPAAPFRYQPLWPFATPAEVATWQQGYRAGGHSPWHLDAEATALAFTTGYLGFSGINVVVSRSIEGNEAYVAVGYPVEGRSPATAAVLHLARFGSGADAPWEVVGSRDSSLTLTEPGYGTRAGSPLRVGGRISGVDESIRVQVRQPSSENPIGESCCLPAGGENTPWSTTVTYSGATAPALTVIASTGGHYTDVERFAITAVRPAG